MSNRKSAEAAPDIFFGFFFFLRWFNSKNFVVWYFFLLLLLWRGNVCAFNFLFFLLLPKKDLSSYQKKKKKGSFGLLSLFFCVRDVYEGESLLLCMGWSSVNWIVRSQKVFTCSVAHVRVERSQSNLLLRWKGWDSIWASLSPQIIIQLKEKKKVYSLFQTRFLC